MHSSQLYTFVHANEHRMQKHACLEKIVSSLTTHISENKFEWMDNFLLTKSWISYLCIHHKIFVVNYRYRQRTTSFKDTRIVNLYQLCYCHILMRLDFDGHEN